MTDIDFISMAFSCIDEVLLDAQTKFKHESPSKTNFFISILSCLFTFTHGEKLLNSLLASESKQQLKIMDTIQRTLHSPYLGSSKCTDLDNNRRGIQYRQVRIGCLLRVSPA